MQWVPGQSRVWGCRAVVVSQAKGLEWWGGGGFRTEGGVGSDGVQWGAGQRAQG